MIDVPARERTLPALLARQAAALGDRPYMRVGATARTFAETAEAAARTAGSLAAAGIGPGDRVAVMAENRREVIDTWFAVAWLGAILVPVNTALRGPQLEHVLTNSGPRALAIEPGLIGHLEVLRALPAELERIWLLDGDGESTWRGTPVGPFPAEADAVAPEPVAPGDTVAILYTSGTTGPSKGVMCPQAQFYWWALGTAAMLGGLSDDDVLYTCLPLFHTNALNTCMQALLHGARLVVGPRFSASRFWSRVAEADATVTYLLGAMASILAKRPPAPEDRAHRVRVALAPATHAELHEVFRERFGITLRDGFGMTETNAVIGARDGVQRPGTMGRVMPGYEARVVDENDEEVRDGVPGELVLRPAEPFAFATGYWRMPEQTVEAWRNLWFHSGDRVVREADGSFRFLDRMKDAIRRRGENISAWEVEQVLLGHPDVAAAAVVPVPSELGEDDVLACVVARADASLDPEELVRYCEPRLAYFAIPRYVEILDELPLTENGKVRKFVLRERGVTQAAWDREAAGYVLRR
jgi:crotonobetaine/carnitine-CoA ligase